MKFPSLISRFHLLSLLVALPLFSTGSALASGGSRVDLPIQSGGPYSVPVDSIRDIRFLTTLRQQYDFSCGSAALATLLSYHYAYQVSEQDVFREMYERGDKNKIRKEGFSLLDMKGYLAAHGYEADGFQADIEQLSAAHVPAIALINENGYHHFVVIKGLRDGRVLIGDPAVGTRTMTVSRFKGMWINKILFVIRNKLDLALFNSDADWRVAPKAVLGDGIYRGAAESLLPKRGPSDY